MIDNAPCDTQKTLDPSIKVLLEHEDPITKVFIHGLKYDVDESTKQACFYVEDIEETSETLGRNARKLLWQSQKWNVILYNERLLPPSKKKPAYKRTFRRKRKGPETLFEVTETITLDVTEDHTGTTHLREYIWKPKIVNTEESFILVTYADTTSTKEMNILPNKLSTSYVSNTSHMDFEMTYDEGDDYSDEFEYETPTGALAKITYVSEKLAHIRKLEHIAEEENNDEEEQEYYEMEPVNIKMSFEPAVTWVEPYDGRYGLSTSHFQLSERFGASCESRLLRVTTRAGYLSDFSQSFSEARKIKRYRNKSEQKQPQYDDLPDDVIVIDKLDRMKANKIPEDDQSTSDDEGFEEIEIEDTKSRKPNIREKNAISPQQNEGKTSKPTLKSVAVSINPSNKRNENTEKSRDTTLDCLKKKREPLPEEFSEFEQYHCQGIMSRRAATITIDLNEEIVIEKPADRTRKTDYVHESKTPAVLTISATLYEPQDNVSSKRDITYHANTKELVDEECIDPKESMASQVEEVNFDSLLTSSIEEENDEFKSTNKGDDMHAVQRGNTENNMEMKHLAELKTSMSAITSPNQPRILRLEDEIIHDKENRPKNKIKETVGVRPALKPLQITPVLLNTPESRDMRPRKVNKELIIEDDIFVSVKSDESKVDIPPKEKVDIFDKNESHKKGEKDLNHFNELLSNKISSDSQKEIVELEEEIIKDKKYRPHQVIQSSEAKMEILPLQIEPVSLQSSTKSSQVQLTRTEKELVKEDDATEEKLEPGEHNGTFAKIITEEDFPICNEVEETLDSDHKEHGEDLKDLKTLIPNEIRRVSVTKFEPDEEVVHERPDRSIKKTIDKRPAPTIQPLTLTPFVKTSSIQVSRLPREQKDLVAENQVLENKLTQDKKPIDDFIKLKDDYNNDQKENNAKYTRSDSDEELNEFKTSFNNVQNMDLQQVEIDEEITREKIQKPRISIAKSPNVASITPISITPVVIKKVAKPSAVKSPRIHKEFINESEIIAEVSKPDEQYSNITDDIYDQKDILLNQETAAIIHDYTSDSELSNFKASLPGEDINKHSTVKLDDEITQEKPKITTKNIARPSTTAIPLLLPLHTTPVVTAVKHAVAGSEVSEIRQLPRVKKLVTDDENIEEKRKEDIVTHFDVCDVDDEKLTKENTYDSTNENRPYLEEDEPDSDSMHQDLESTDKSHVSAETLEIINKTKNIKCVSTFNKDLDEGERNECEDENKRNVTTTVMRMRPKESKVSHTISLQEAHKESLEEIGSEEESVKGKKKSLKSRAKKMIFKSFKHDKSEKKSFDESGEVDAADKNKKKKHKSKFSLNFKPHFTDNNEKQSSLDESAGDGDNEQSKKKKSKAKFSFKTKQDSVDGTNKKNSIFHTSKGSKDHLTESSGEKKIKYTRSETQPVLLKQTNFQQQKIDINIDNKMDGHTHFFKRKVTRSHSFDSILDTESTNKLRDSELNERRRRLAGYSYVSNINIPNESEIVKGREYTIEACAKETEKEINRVRHYRKKSRSNSSSSKMSMHISVEVLDKLNQPVGHVKIPEVFLGKHSNGSLVANQGSVGRIKIPQAFSVEDMSNITMSNKNLKLAKTEEMLI
ncbi:uncharacterized protein LOC130635849 [Hydractinia symbiolongicarpus]|uniref:uncharacterized protein LOC130635849 n=1 Tax=Hydractinia symbiolongicarpus TaxID=13093 RepID=UPI00254A51F8|nr:uncharacterized protein LOC130635849 [Hydractinia symbiolongicarpus]